MNSILVFLRKYRITFLLGSLTLGLAPFNPPHIVGKLKWLAGGAVGMEGKDWFDLFFHGTPWLLLFASIVLLIKDKVTQKLS